MKQYHCTDNPIKVYGLQNDLLPNKFWRLSEDMLGKVTKEVAKLARQASGGRVRFRTNSANVTVTTKFHDNAVDRLMPLTGSAGSDVYIGRGAGIRFVGSAYPYTYEENTGVLSFQKSAIMEDITICLPRNVELEDVLIELDENAGLEPPTPYAVERPMVFYGSSITQGGSATRPSNAYTAILSKWLDADYINLGFSGSAKGEPELASYIASLAMSALVLDYDHNAPSVAHLANTHEPFFKIIRQEQPELPVLFLTKPDFDSDPEAAPRRAVIFQTYQNARSSGDDKVFFVDGETYFGNDDRELCTIDRCHPNDLGFMSMAKTIYPTLKKILYPD